MPKVTSRGFKKGDGTNLPVIDAEMLRCFYKATTFLSPEVRNVKTSRSCRESYGDKAIGFVEVCRLDTICRVQAKVTPEHRVHSKNYSVYCDVDEDTNQILDAQCEDCAASEGGCKHVIAFVAWLHRRSEDNSPTEQACYWKKAKLSDIGSSNKFMKIDEVRPHKTFEVPPEKSELFLNYVTTLLQQNSSNALLLKQISETTSLSLYHLMIAYKRTSGAHSGAEFIKFCTSVMKQPECDTIFRTTKAQCNTAQWYDMRYARVTASKIYEASRCRTPDGSLVKRILGAKSFDTSAMERGRMLEPLVLKNVGVRYGGQVQPCGLKLQPNMPEIGASPDGILKDAVVEVKCPINYDTFKTYFRNNYTEPAPKFKGQLMLQMLMCKKLRGLYCVAEPTFKVTGNVTSIYVDFNAAYTSSLVEDARNFWITNIYQRLYDSINI